MTKRILISAPYMLRERDKVEQYLKPLTCTIDWAEVKERLSESELIAIIDRYDGIICGDDRFSEAVYKKARRLKAVVKWGTGIDSIQADIAQKYDIKVRRTPDAFTMPVADSTLGLMLAFVRNIPGNDVVLKSGGWHKPQGYSIAEKTIGLIGFGQIGQAVAKRLRPFEPQEVLAYDCADKGSAFRDLNVKKATLAEIFEEADIISLHCDLNSTSEHILNADAFKAMKRHPIVINTARGPLIDEKALINALETNLIKNAGLDVFEEEPLPLDSPLRKSDRVLLSSHNTNSSPKAWDRVHRLSIAMLAEELGLALD